MKMRFISCLLLLSACSPNEVQMAPLRPVKYEKVKDFGKGEERTFAGVAHAEIETKLSFKVPGTIEHLPVKVGDFVSDGQLIAALDQLDYQLQVQEAEAALLDAEAKKRNAVADYARIRELYETKAVSRQELDAARASSESGNANVEAATKKRDLAKAQLQYTTLLAPRTGGLSSVDVEVNENVGVGQVIAVLHSGDLIEVVVAIPESYIADIKTGMPVIAAFDARPGTHYPAKVFKVGVASDVTTTFPVTVKLNEQALGVRPGMAAEVRFNFLRSEEVQGVLIPASAVLGEGEKRFVFVLHPTDNGEGKVEKREVTIGRITNRGIQILQGLSEEDLIITAGIPFLQDGETVRAD